MKINQIEINKFLDLEYSIGIPEQVGAFQEQAENLLHEMNVSGKTVHKKYLLSLIRRQQAFLSQFE